MTERVPIYVVSGAAWAVTTSDGRFFRCVIEPIGAERQLRWTFTDSEGRRFIGPLSTAALYLDELQALVEDSWRSKVALGQRNANSATLRAQLNNEDN